MAGTQKKTFSFFQLMNEHLLIESEKKTKTFGLNLGEALLKGFSALTSYFLAGDDGKLN